MSIEKILEAAGSGTLHGALFYYKRKLQLLEREMRLFHTGDILKSQEQMDRMTQVEQEIISTTNVIHFLEARIKAEATKGIIEKDLET